MATAASQRSFYEVRPSAIHGMGVFACCKFGTDARVVEYVGERISKKESLWRRKAGNFFVFIVTEEFDIDGDVEWNPARFINHSCAPNCEARQEQGHIWIIAKRDIQAGEELSFNYGYDLQDYEDHPCKCGALNCIGYMVAEEHFGDVREKKRL